MPHKPIPVNATGVLIADVATDNGAPTLATDGFALSGDTHLLLSFGSTHAYGSYHAQVYFYDIASKSWALDKTYGTAGNITVNSNAKYQYAINRLYSRVYVQALTFTSGMKASAWGLQADVTG